MAATCDQNGQWDIEFYDGDACDSGRYFRMSDTGSRCLNASFDASSVKWTSNGTAVAMYSKPDCTGSLVLEAPCKDSQCHRFVSGQRVRSVRI